jgi:predicted MFS family arabinose efflux permease
MFMLADKENVWPSTVGGTIGFGLAAPIAGLLVQNYGLQIAFWGCAVFLLLALLISQKLVYDPQKASDSPYEGVRTLLANRRWLPFLMVAFAGGIAAAAINNYLFPYLKELGASESAMGISLTIGTLSEIPVLFFGNRLIQRFKPYGLLMLAMVITGMRLIFLATASTPNLVLVSQLLNGLSFPAMWIAGVAYANENAPPGLGATAQGMFGAMVFGFGTAVGGFAGGPLLESLGGHGFYLVYGIVVLVMVAFAVLVAQLFQRNGV